MSYGMNRGPFGVILWRNGTNVVFEPLRADFGPQEVTTSGDQDVIPNGNVEPT
jgi:hypothetical protein